MMKAATAYRRNGQVLLHASSKTTSGVWVVSDPIAVTSESNPEELGRLAREALSGSMDGVPHPTSWKGFFDPVLALAGVRTLSAFIKSTKCVEMELDGAIITLIPTRNGGLDEGFAPLVEKARTVPQSSEQLGAALVAALADAE